MRNTHFRRQLALMLGTALSLGAGPLLAQEPRMKPKAVRQLLERRQKLTFVPGEIIVKRKIVAGAVSAVPEARIRDLGLAPDPRPTSGGEVVYRLAPQVMGALSTEAAHDRTLAAVAALKASPEVEYAQPNYILHIVASPNDPEFRRQWHYRDNGTATGQSAGGINLPRTWDTNQGSSSVVVAVIDTGILPNHPDIAGSPNLAPGFDMVSGELMANDGDGRDPDPTDPGDGSSAGQCGPGSPAQPDSWHGTHVAGTIGVGRTNNALGVAGVNWSVKVQAVRVLGRCGGTIEDINDAIRWAAGLSVPGVPANPTPARVMNLSLGGSGSCSQSPSTQAAIDDAVAAGATVVVAAGNDAADARDFLPASCERVVTVAAGDGRGRLVSRYSNFGAAVEILAPGGDVERDDDNDDNPDGVYSMVRGGYEYYNGTSMATPHAAGVAALVLAANASFTPAQVLARLQETAIPRSAAECPRPCGAGLLNAFAPLVTITLAPPEIELDDRGERTLLRATLRRGGAFLPGETVAFRSDDPNVATVDPATAVTDGSGQASTQVTAGSNGRTSVRAEAQGSQQSAPVRVPALSDAGLLVLALLAFLLPAHRVRS